MYKIWSQNWPVHEKLTVFPVFFFMLLFQPREISLKKISFEGKMSHMVRIDPNYNQAASKLTKRRRVLQNKKKVLLSLILPECYLLQFVVPKKYPYQQSVENKVDMPFAFFNYCDQVPWLINMRNLFAVFAFIALVNVMLFCCCLILPQSTWKFTGINISLPKTPVVQEKNQA